QAASGRPPRRAVHEGVAANAAVRLLGHGHADPQDGGRAGGLHRRRAAEPRDPRGHQDIRQLADDPAALREGRVRGRLRHHEGDVPVRRAAEAPVDREVKRLAAAALLLLAFAAPALADSVTVFAAASLKESLDDAAAAFKAKTGHHVAVSYGGSNALARHVTNGAPADVFVSADGDWMDYVDQRGVLVPGS